MCDDATRLFADITSTPEGVESFLQFARRGGHGSYEDFIDCLYQKLQQIFERLEHSKDKFFSHDEDAITGIIAARLEEAGYTATEQTKKNGAVDLTVTLGDYSWIAEAKIAYSNSKILEGLLQLLTRYVTRDTDAGLFIYVKKQNGKKVFNDWIKYICEGEAVTSYIVNKNPEVKEDAECVLRDVKATDIKQKEMMFNSIHELVSGFPINVKHFCANLYFNPADKSGNNSQKQRKDNALNNLACIYFESLETECQLDQEKCKIYLEQLFRDLDPDDFVS